MSPIPASQASPCEFMVFVVSQSSCSALEGKALSSCRDWDCFCVGAAVEGDVTSKVSGGFIPSSAADKPNSLGNIFSLIKWGKAVFEVISCFWLVQRQASNGHSVPAISMGTSLQAALAAKG